MGDTRVTQRVRDLAEIYRQQFYGNDESIFEKKYRDVAEECFRVKTVKNRETTRVETRAIYDQLIAAFGHMDIKSLTDEHWLDQIEDWKTSTKRRKFNPIRVYAHQIDKYAISKGYKRAELVLPVHDRPPIAKESVSDTDFRLLLEFAKTRLHRTSMRAFVPLALMLWRHMGLRKDEALGLEWDRVELGTRVLTLNPDDVKTGTRTLRGRTIAIPLAVIPYFIKAAEFSPGQFVFQGRCRNERIVDMKASLQRMVEETGIEFTPQTLRFTFCDQKVLVEKKQIQDVAKYVGNSVAVLERRYLGHKPEHTRYLVEEGANLGHTPEKGAASC